MIMDDSLIENYSNSENLYSDNINNPETKMPQNLEAEQSLLGSILFDNKILEDIPTNFNNQYFFLTHYMRVYMKLVYL
jgi:hypothetical protein